MIRFYLDISGSKRDRVIAAAGYLASDAQWRAFERTWSAILRDAKVNHFHATDFFNCRGAFKKWIANSPEQNRFGARFAGAVRKYTEVGFAFGLDLDHFDRELGPINAKIKTPHDRMSPEMVCVARLLNRAARLILLPQDLTAAVYLEQGRGVGEVIGYVRQLEQLGEPSLRAYSSFEAVPKSTLPVQAADLLAHESWRRITDHLRPSGRDIRKPLRTLLADERVEVHVATQNDFRRTAAKLEEFLAVHPTYVARSRRDHSP